MAYIWRESSDKVDWEALASLYRVAPLGEKKPDDLKTVFSNSRLVCFVYEGAELVGAGRVLADGLDCACLCDVAVHPGHQGLGLGRDIVARLVALSKGHRKIILYAVPGKEAFYRKLGFKHMTTAMAIFDDPAQALRRGLVDDS